MPWLPLRETMHILRRSERIHRARKPREVGGDWTMVVSEPGVDGAPIPAVRETTIELAGSTSISHSPPS
jgi:hypothetical protein